MKKSRLQNSILNFTSGLAYRLLHMLLSFAIRTVFIYCLSADYLGINGLYGNILTMLSLAELGFGVAMVYSLYQPLATNDQLKLAQLMGLYKQVYRIIGTVILFLGLALVPFLDVLIKDPPNVDGLTFYYLIFLGNTVLSYWFFAYRNAILQADQKVYLITGLQGLFHLIKSVIQILLLLLLRNYTVFLLVQSFSTIAQNITTAIVTRRHYPGIFQKAPPLPEQDRKRIFADVRALMIQRVCFVALNGTDSLITSAFVGIRWVGLVSNYQLVIDSISGILSQFTSAISASMGNFFAQEDKDAGYRLFLRVDFISFWLYSFCFVALITLLNPFVTLWLGSEFTMAQSVVLWLGLRFFVACLMNTFSTVRYSRGLFVQSQLRPLVAAVMNIVLSIWLSHPFGISGILMATVITRLCVNLWHHPLIIHRDGFQRSVKPYYRLWLGRFVLIAALALIMAAISRLILAGGVTIWNFALLTILTAIIPNGILLLLYRNNENFAYFLDLITKFLQKLRRRK
ncbi:MAG: sugar translocase [Oscillospiraceae bacterium]|nr:sugar translocase [Oscillospiraceae bacterium]